MIIPDTTAESGGNPSPTINGTATAAGVPKPAEPSIKVPNSQAITMTCTRRSGEISTKPRRMTCNAPLSRSVLSKRIAPKIISKSERATITPCSVAAKICNGDIFQTKRASNATVMYEKGMARLAGQRSTTSSRPTTKIGNKARKASKKGFIA